MTAHDWYKCEGCGFEFDRLSMRNVGSRHCTSCGRRVRTQWSHTSKSQASSVIETNTEEVTDFDSGFFNICSRCGGKVGHKMDYCGSCGAKARMEPNQTLGNQSLPKERAKPPVNAPSSPKAGINWNKFGGFVGVAGIALIIGAAVAIQQLGFLGLVIVVALVLIPLLYLARSDGHAINQILGTVFLIPAALVLFWLISQGQGDEGDYCQRCQPTIGYEQHISLE